MSAVMKEQDLSVTLHMDANLQEQIRQGENALSIAEAYVIDCADMAQLAADERKALAGQIDRLKELRSGFLAPAQQIIDNAKALFDPPLKALEGARNLLKDRLLAWDALEKRRIDAENAARAEAARKARQEAERIAAAELARANELAAAARRQAEEAEAARRQAEAEGNKRAAAAAAAQAAKAEAQAQAILENAEVTAMEAHTAAAVTHEAPVVQAKIAGSALRDNWVAELLPNTTEDQAKALIVQAVPNNPQLLGLLKVDLSAIGKMAKALKEVMQVPGYKAVNKPTLAGSRK